MNERLKELLEEATEIHDDRGTGISHPVVDQKVFAELIVKECIQVCKSRVGNSDYTTGRMHCVSDLKEHFGVEK
jgi:hypothetical protein